MYDMKWPVQTARFFLFVSKITNLIIRIPRFRSKNKLGTILASDLKRSVSNHFLAITVILALVHTMLDKLENATILFTVGPSVHTTKHLNPHKMILENGTFKKRFPEWNNLKTKLFCIIVDGDLFVPRKFSNTPTSFCHLIYPPRYFNMADNMKFAVLLTIIIFFNRLLRVKYCFKIHIDVVRQRTRNNFIQELMESDTTDTIGQEQHHIICF